MKKSFYVFAVTCVLGVTQTIAQQASVPLVAKQTVTPQNFISADEVSPVKFSVDAEERFAKEYKDANSVSWSREGERYKVKFIQNNVNCVVDYTANGKQYSFIRYGTSLLPASIKESINNKFDVKSILSVSEVRIAGFNSVAYVVVLEDRNSVKTLRIIDNDVETISEEIKKG